MLSDLGKCLEAAERTRWDRQEAWSPGHLPEGHAMCLVRNGQHELLVKLCVKPSTRRWGVQVSSLVLMLTVYDIS